MSSDDERFMDLALDLARRGLGAVEPNPMVGAVIVRDSEEIGRGWHRRFGGPHAEIEAMDAAGRAGRSVRGATMYVTLEPCCSHGKTPPCTEAILRAGIARVVVAMADPDAKVSGRGLRALRQGGIEVRLGVREGKARRLLRAYGKLRSQGRPWVLCKWAQTADGYLAVPAGGPRWITGRAARDHVHQVRGHCDGVLVGIGTVLADDPLLTNRSGQGKQPTRVVLDSRLRTPPACHLVRSVETAPLLIATARGVDRRYPAAARRLREAGAELFELPLTERGLDLAPLLDELGRRQWTYLLVEGGATVLRSFVDGGWADELLAYVAPRRLGVTAQVLPRFDVAEVRRALSLEEADRQALGQDELRRYLLTDPQRPSGRRRPA